MRSPCVCKSCMSCMSCMSCIAGFHGRPFICSLEPSPLWHSALCTPHRRQPLEHRCLTLAPPSDTLLRLNSCAAFVAGSSRRRHDKAGLAVDAASLNSSHGCRTAASRQSSKAIRAKSQAETMQVHKRVALKYLTKTSDELEALQQAAHQSPRVATHLGRRMHRHTMLRLLHPPPPPPLLHFNRRTYLIRPISSSLPHIRTPFSCLLSAPTNTCAPNHDGAMV